MAPATGGVSFSPSFLPFTQNQLNAAVALGYWVPYWLYSRPVRQAMAGAFAHRSIAPQHVSISASFPSRLCSFGLLPVTCYPLPFARFSFLRFCLSLVPFSAFSHLSDLTP